MPFSYGTVMTSRGFTGSDIGPMSYSADVSECKSRCNSQPTCKGIAVSKSKNNNNKHMCYLKSIYPTAQNTVSNSSWDTYPVLDGTVEIQNIYNRLFRREATLGELKPLLDSYINNQKTLSTIETELTATAATATDNSNRYKYIYDNVEIDPNDSTPSGLNTDESYNNRATESDIQTVLDHQNGLAAEKDIKQSLLNEINANLNYTVMAMTIWVPLGVLAGYYLYKTNIKTA
jgi:hypothetical protein